MKFFVFFGFFLSVVSANAEMLFKTVSTEIEKNKTVVSIEFAEDVGVANLAPEYINNTIQLDIPQAVLGLDSKSIKVNENNLKKVYLYQPEKDLFRARMILRKTQKASLYQDSVKIRKEGHKILVIIKSPETSWVKVGEEERIKVLPRDINSDLEEAVEQALNISPTLSKKPTLVVDSEKDSKKESKVIASVAAGATKLKSKGALSKKSENSSLKESEIPVLVKQKEVKAEAASPYFRMIASLFVIILVAGGSVLFGKKWARGNKVNEEQTKIQVLTQHHLGPKKSLAIIRVAGESILVGVTDHNISMIKTLALIDDEVPEHVPNNFSDAMGFMEDNEDYEQASQVVISGESEKSAEEFTYGNIRKTISKKMKDLRPI